MSVRDRLLDAGVSLLRDQGASALTQPRIAAAAGVSQSHLTYYFPTRDALLLAIAEHSVDQELQRATADSGGHPAERLAQAARFLPRVRMMLGLVASGDRDPAIRPAFARLATHVREALGQLLAHHGYTVSAPQVVVVHAALVGLAIMNLGRQDATSDADVELGLRQLLALLPHPERTEP